MILNSLKDSASIESLHPLFKKAFDYIKATDFSTVPAGKIVLDGDKLYISVAEPTGKTKETARMETHDKYIDIQVPLSKEETFGVKPRSECKIPDGEMNTVKDILFYKDPVEETKTIAPGEAVTFAPDTAHAPLIGEGKIHKAIFKVKVI